MSRFLAEIAGDNLKSGEDDLMSAIEPLLKLLSLTVIGLVLAHKKIQIIPKATFKLLSKLVFALFLPCLIFTYLGQSITLKNIVSWWFIPVNVLISTFIGGVLGILVVIVCRPPPEFNRFTIVMTAFGNTGNLPLAILGSICHTEASYFGPDCYRKGVAYVSFAQWVAVILVYTVVYHMMEPPMEYYEIVEEGRENEEQKQGGETSKRLIVEMGRESEEKKQGDETSKRLIVEEGRGNEEQKQGGEPSKRLMVEAEWPGIENKETEHCKTPFIARIFRSISNVSQTNVPDLDHTMEGRNSPKSVGCLAAPKVVRKIRIVAEQTPIEHIFQPPTIASLLAIIVGMVPRMKAFVFGYDAPLSFLTDSLEILAGAMVPSVMLILGGMLAEGPTDTKLGLRTTTGIIVARLLILPLLGIGVVSLADKLDLLVDADQMFRFVLLLQYTMPSAILLGAIASLRGYAVSESSALLFWQHLFALISLSLYLVIYFKFLPFV